MKAALLLLIAFNVSPISATEKLPEVPDAKSINKVLSPVKGGCDQCEVVTHSSKGQIPSLPHWPTNAMVEKVKTLKSNLECVSGRKRLQKDVSFFTSSAVSNKGVLAGNFQPGFLADGTISDLHVGVSAFKDLMFVTKVTKENKVIGYNVTISFCELPNHYKDMPGIISDSRSLENFTAPRGIMIADDNSSCGYGSVVTLGSTIVSRRDPASAYGPSDAPLSTSFVEHCKK